MKDIKTLLSVLAAVVVTAAACEIKNAYVASGATRSAREDARATFKDRYGFADGVLFLHADVKAETVVTKDMLLVGNYITEGVGGRLLYARDLKSVLGRKVAFDLKRGSVLLETDLCPGTDP